MSIVLTHTDTYSTSSLPERIAKKITVSDGGCWLWTGSIIPSGYGYVWWCNRAQRVHRVVYTLLVGPIPHGLDLDHVKARGCTSRACVNPAHLEPVTHRENVLRGSHPKAVAHRTGICVAGLHQLSDDPKQRRRGCAGCRRDRRAAEKLELLAA